ncbi:MAG: hypothetical protein WCL50_08835 [Spirochaetota bacterium]
MRRLMLISIALLSSLTVIAQSAPPPDSPPRGGDRGLLLHGGWIGQELDGIAADLGDTKLSDLTGNDLQAYRQRLMIAAKKTAFVGRASMLSFMLPGSSQFATGNPGTGAAFLVANLAIIGGGLVGGYYLLPADLRFDRLDYLGAPIGGIKTSWESHSIKDYLPFMAVMAAGGFLDFHLRLFSAGNAAHEAKRLIDEGKVDLEARPGFMGMKLKL